MKSVEDRYLRIQASDTAKDKLRRVMLLTKGWPGRNVNTLSVAIWVVEAVNDDGSVDQDVIDELGNLTGLSDDEVDSALSLFKRYGILDVERQEH